jgi:hypothetical protein
MYGLPESPDSLMDCLATLFDSDNWRPLLKSRLNMVKMHIEYSDEKKLEESRKLLQEKHTQKSLVGLFSKYDKLVLERMVGTQMFRKIIQQEAKDSYTFE